MSLCPLPSYRWGLLESGEARGLCSKFSPVPRGLRIPTLLRVFFGDEIHTLLNQQITKHLAV